MAVQIGFKPISITAILTSEKNPIFYLPHKWSKNSKSIGFPFFSLGFEKKLLNG